MPTTESFYVSKSSGKLLKTNAPHREYFAEGNNKAKYIIEVFGDNHDAVAKKVMKMVEGSELKDKLFKIEISTR